MERSFFSQGMKKLALKWHLLTSVVSENKRMKHFDDKNPHIISSRFSADNKLNEAPQRIPIMIPESSSLPSRVWTECSFRKNSHVSGIPSGKTAETKSPRAPESDSRT